MRSRGVLLGRLTLSLLARFGVVGAMATLVYLVVTVIAGEPRFGLSAVTANVAGFAASLIFSYFGHAIATYEVGGEHQRYAPRFLVATAILVAVCSILTYGVVDVLGFDRRFAAIAVAVLYPISSLLLHTAWTFGPGDHR
jgi:putative flippase GtrA